MPMNGFHFFRSDIVTVDGKTVYVRSEDHDLAENFLHMPSERIAREVAEAFNAAVEKDRQRDLAAMEAERKPVAAE